MKILRLNLENKQYRYEELAAEYQVVGGRGLIAGFLNREVAPDCYPLGKENKLIICNGPLSGTGVSSADRLSIGGKSPLTGGIKESNAGGMSAAALAGLGLRAVILENALSGEDDWQLIKIEEQQVDYISAADYKGLGNYDLQRKLKEDFGKEYELITIGQAGENLYLNSGIATTDMYGRPARMAARGGLGSVMGSKKIKGILIRNDGTYQHPGLDNQEFRAARKAYHKLVSETDRIQVLREFGTASTVMDVQKLGALPTCNFSRGKFTGAEQLSGENIHEIIDKRGGEGTNSEPCMKGCIIQCSNAYPGDDGKEIVAPLEYETLGLVGSNLGLSDPDDVARINYICNDYGLDTIETGGVLGVMAEAGLVEFGNADEFISIIREVPEDTCRGRMVGMGTGITARFLNVRRAPVVKNQCLSAYDPRGVKGTGVTYATSPMGADHTAGLTVFMPMDHHDKKDQVETSLNMQLGRAGYDSLGLCVFLMAATAPHPDKIVDMLNGLYETDLDPDYINNLGARTIREEKEFNKRAGFDREDDRIPDYFREEELPPFGLKWDIEDEELDSIFSNLDR